MKGVPPQLTIQNNYGVRNATTSSQRIESQQDSYVWGIYNFKYPRGWTISEIVAYDVEVEGGGTADFVVGIKIIPPDKNENSKDVVSIGGYKVEDCNSVKDSTCTMGAVNTIAPDAIYTYSSDASVLNAQKVIASSFQINKR
jgi:predicted Zn-dependent protease